MRTYCAAMILCITLSMMFCPGGASAAGGKMVWLSDLDISKTQQGWSSPRKDLSVDGNAMRIGGQTLKKGLGTHADSILYVQLDGGSRRFTAQVGVDDEAAQAGSVEFRILGDGKELYKSGTIRRSDKAKQVDIDVSGVKLLALTVNGGPDGINYDHADWAEAAFEVVGAQPKTIDGPKEEPVILTPKPSLEPRINSAKVFGVRPGSPVLYTIAATGQRPMQFAADGLPKGLSLDPATGQITGSIRERGEYKITLTASNPLGKATRSLRLVVGDTIALTPPLGWNSWNCWGCAVDEQKIREAADAMVASGLAHHGWQYINIDDCWMVKRNSNDPVVGGPTRDDCGRILTNDRFPDMKALTDYVHGVGLKMGIYISPGPWTCQEYEGSWQHEMVDAFRFADWGFDYLKYDWCGYGSIAPQPTLKQMKDPYLLMRLCLDRVDRDIAYSLCQYGMGDVWKWGAEVGGNCWRTTGDISDSWGSMSGIGFAQNDKAQVRLASHGPGLPSHPL